jgi:multifunctional beta-oxidation protein
MTETIMPPDMLKGLKPEFIAPLVGVLTAKNVCRLTKPGG